MPCCALGPMSPDTALGAFALYELPAQEPRAGHTLGVLSLLLYDQVA